MSFICRQLDDRGDRCPLTAVSDDPNDIALCREHLHEAIQLALTTGATA